MIQTGPNGGSIMTNPVRIMPCLDMQKGRVVKGVHFVDIKDAGDPVECAKAYCAAGADELAMLDITATIEHRGTLLDVVSRVAKVVTIPFTVGGGISDVKSAEAVLKGDLPEGASQDEVKSAIGYVIEELSTSVRRSFISFQASGERTVSRVVPSVYMAWAARAACVSGDWSLAMSVSK